LKELSIRSETLEIVEKNRAKPLEDKSMNHDTLSSTPMAQEVGARIDKQDCVKLKSFYTARE
jgi:hypothetical protein